MTGFEPATPTTPLHPGTTESGTLSRFSLKTAGKVAIAGGFLATVCGELWRRNGVFLQEYSDSIVPPRRPRHWNCISSPGTLTPRSSRSPAKPDSPGSGRAPRRRGRHRASIERPAGRAPRRKVEPRSGDADLVEERGLLHLEPHGPHPRPGRDRQRSLSPLRFSQGQGSRCLTTGGARQGKTRSIQAQGFVANGGDLSGIRSGRRTCKEVPTP